MENLRMLKLITDGSSRKGVEVFKTVPLDRVLNVYKQELVFGPQDKLPWLGNTAERDVRNRFEDRYIDVIEDHKYFWHGSAGVLAWYAFGVGPLPPEKQLVVEIMYRTLCASKGDYKTKTRSFLMPPKRNGEQHRYDVAWSGTSIAIGLTVLVARRVPA